MNKKEKQFKAYLEALYDELSGVKTHFEIFRELVTAQGKYNREMNQAPSFWARTKEAHADVCLYGLMRLVADRHDDALTLHKFLRYIESNLDLFQTPRFGWELDPDDDVSRKQQEAYQKALPEGLKKDITELESMMATLKSLEMWRNKLYAHRDRGVVLQGVDITAKYPIKYREIEGLIEKCTEIVLAYGLAFDMIHREIGLPGTEQVEEGVFEPLRRERAARRAVRGLPPDKQA